MALTKVDDRGLKTPIDLQDNEKIRLGTGNDLEIYHDGTDSILKDTRNSGNLRIHADSIGFNDKDVSETMLLATADGSVDLYYNGSKKFETTASGVDVTGNCTITGNFRGNDGVMLNLGNSDDLQIYHDGADDRIDSGSTNSMIIASKYLRLMNQAANETMAKFTENGAVELNYDNSKKFETTSSGITVSGSDTTGSIIQGDFRLKTASGTQHIVYDASNSRINFADSINATFGDANDLQIYHDGTNSIIKNTQEDLYIDCQSDDLILKAADNIFIQPDSGDNGININGNGAVELYYDNSKKFETQDTGAKVTGTLSVTGAIYTDNEFNMTGQGNKFIDTAHKDHYLYFRRINDGDGGHATHCTINSSGEWSANFNDTSDEKLKENITAISDGAISKVKQLRPVNFDWKETDKSNNVSGFIAQEIKTVLPNLVYGTEYDPTIVDEESQRIKSTGYSVNTIGIVAHLTKALQEAITKIETLETEVAALKAA